MRASSRGPHLGSIILTFAFCTACAAREPPSPPPVAASVQQGPRPEQAAIRYIEERWNKGNFEHDSEILAPTYVVHFGNKGA
jgi:hypothetical protein